MGCLATTYFDKQNNYNLVVKSIYDIKKMIEFTFSTGDKPQSVEIINFRNKEGIPYIVGDINSCIFAFNIDT